MTSYFKKTMRCLLTLLLLMAGISMKAATIKYSLKTKVDGRTITGTATLSAGASLEDNMPQALWRGYTTYKYYSDEAMTEEITTAPSSNATVYVDYVFDPPFILSEEGKDPVWHYLRTYNSGGTTNYLLYYDGWAEDEIGKQTILSYKGIPKAGRNNQMTKSTHCQWAFYGDAFDFNIMLNDGQEDPMDNPWLVWTSTNQNEAPLGIGDKPVLGWQLYKNTATNTKLPNGGTAALGVPGTTNYLADLENVSSTQFTDFIDTSSHHFDNKNQLVTNHSGTGSQATMEKKELWWYAIFATPVDGYGTTTDIWHVTYKILQADGTWYEDIVKQKKSSNLTPAFPTEYEQKEGYLYEYFYLDPDFTEKCADNYKMPNNENTVLFIRESKVISTTWKTLCVPFDVADLEGGQYPGIEVWEYTSVTTEKTSSTGYSFNLHFTKTDEIKANYPYLYRFVDASEIVVNAFDDDLADIKDAEAWDESELIAVPQVDTNYPEAQVVMKGTYADFVLTPKVNDEDPYYFYFGYNASQDKYKFYPVKTKNVTMTAFKCYFYAVGTESSAVSFNMDGSVDAISEINAAVTTNQNGIYNINGQLVGKGNVENLPAGVYVKNGKKVVVK